MHIINQPLKCLETFADLSSHVLKTITSNDSGHVVFLTDQSWKKWVRSNETNRWVCARSIPLNFAPFKQNFPK